MISHYETLYELAHADMPIKVVVHQSIRTNGSVCQRYLDRFIGSALFASEVLTMNAPYKARADLIFRTWVEGLSPIYAAGLEAGRKEQMK